MVAIGWIRVKVHRIRPLYLYQFWIVQFDSFDFMNYQYFIN